MSIKPAMVRQLREMTGAGMMDCKKALEAAGGDMDAAVDNLRKQGMKRAEKKAERETGEGRVFATMAGDGRRAHMVVVECETDFLAGSDKFKAFVGELADHVGSEDPDGLDAGSRPLLSQPWKGSTVGEAVKESVGTFGENVRVTRLERLENPEGLVGTYVHHDNKQGAIVSVTTSADAAKAEEALRSLCQHIVVFRPGYAVRDEVPADEVERERQVILESDEVKKKPEEFRGKIVEGKLGRFFAANTLSEQPWIHDDKQTVAKALEKELGDGTRIESFQLVRIGG